MKSTLCLIALLGECSIDLQWLLMVWCFITTLQHLRGHPSLSLVRIVCFSINVTIIAILSRRRILEYRPCYIRVCVVISLVLLLYTTTNITGATTFPNPYFI